MLTRQWIEPQEITTPPLEIGGNQHPLLLQTLARRGFTDTAAARAFLDADYYEPSPPQAMPDMAAATARLAQAIRHRENICVWGDFDVDGQTATTILYTTLQALGANASYHIPVRADESHGVNLPVLKRVISSGVRLLLTCDTGVGSYEAVAYARAHGTEVIITDHHELPQLMPPAFAIVNPKLLPETHPLRDLPGAGVAYKLAEALYQEFNRNAEGVANLDLTALGIVADLAILRGDTRYLLQKGLAALRNTERLGLRTLMQVAEVAQTSLNEEHISFALAPRLNALGRLSDANAIIELFTTDNLTRARILANELEGLNARRQLLCEQVFQAAQMQIERDPTLLQDAALVLSHPAWPAGVIGIVASRLVELYNRPAVLIAAPKGDLAHGSARSVSDCNITAAISTQQHLLSSFGGHPMAAGLSLATENIPSFRRGLAEAVQQQRGPMLERPSLSIDGYLPLAELNLDLVAILERLAPFGPGNPSLTLASRGLSLVSSTGIGRNKEHLQVIVADEYGQEKRVIWWQGAAYPLPEGRFDLAYSVRTSDYRGQRDIQVEWIDARPLVPSQAELRRKEKNLILHDLRQEANKYAAIERLRAAGVQVWSEADKGMPGANRYQLQPSRSLAIWTAPPGPAELRQALSLVQPEEVYFFAIAPGLEAATDFLQRLVGMTKYVINRQEGLTSLNALSAATAHREATVRLGLEWLQARGHLQLTINEDLKLRLTAGNGQIRNESSEIEMGLKAALAETAAYRAYLVKANIGAIL